MQVTVPCLLVTRREDHKITGRITQVAPNHPLVWEWKAAVGITGKVTTGQIIPTIKLGYDIENYGSVLDEQAGLLLSSFYWFSAPFILVVDNTSVDNSEIFSEEELEYIEFVAHSAGHEAKWGIRKKFEPFKYHCTMVREQVLMAGMEGFRFDLVNVCQRRLKEIPDEWSKDTRSDFTSGSSSFVFEDKHVLYNATDAWVLPYIFKAQEALVNRYNQQFLINCCRARLIRALAEAEVTGFVHNSEKWLGIARARYDQAKKLAADMDHMANDVYGIYLTDVSPTAAEGVKKFEARVEKWIERVEKLKAEILRMESQDKTHLKAYTITKEQLIKAEENPPKQPEENSINWDSPIQVLTFLRLIHCPIPKAKAKDSPGLKEGVGKEARANWFVEHGDSPFSGFMSKFDKYKQLMHNVNSFGETWIQKYTHPQTKKVYTTFRQADTATLRLASGNADNGLFNLQQIPAREGPEYRECFGTDPGRSIITLDYTGCEIVAMISLSRDLNLKRVSEMPDQHSYMGTKCWRAVYQARYERTGDPKWLDLAQSYVMDQSTPEKKKERTRFKESGVFACVYGVKPPKVAAIQRFAVQDAAVFIKVIEDEMPNVFNFVKGKAAEALVNGYVIHNTRTNSRRWFTPVINQMKYGDEITRSQQIEIESAARNTCVQGTNVDLIVEAMCLIDLWKRLFKVDLRLLGQVHDEVIYDCPTEDVDWICDKVEQLMVRAAQNYLIPELSMKVDARKGLTWKK